MTREIKLALILGSALALIVGVLVSDHMSAARRSQIAEIKGELGTGVSAHTRAAAATRDANANWQDVVAHLPANKIEEPAAPTPSGARPGADAPKVATIDHDAALIEEAKKRGVEIQSLTMTDTIATGDAPAQPAPAPVREHVIREGDTLWSIAQKYYGDGRLHTRLEEANHEALAKKRGLDVGQRIRVPEREAHAPADSSLALQTPADPAAKDPLKDAKPAKYVVKPGDTLVGVARKTLGSERRWEEILALNSARIPDPDALSVGAELRLPPR